MLICFLLVSIFPLLGMIPLGLSHCNTLFHHLSSQNVIFFVQFIDYPSSVIDFPFLLYELYVVKYNALTLMFNSAKNR